MVIVHPVFTDVVTNMNSTSCQAHGSYKRHQNKVLKCRILGHILNNRLSIKKNKKKTEAILMIPVSQAYMVQKFKCRCVPKSKKDAAIQYNQDLKDLKI